MKRIVAVLDFLKFPVNDKIEFYKYVAVQMANTVLFPALAIRNDKELIADNVFRQVLLYVNKVANGNGTIITQSGFNQSKEPTPIVKAEIAVNDGPHSGSVMVAYRFVKGAASYKIMYRKSALRVR